MAKLTEEEKCVLKFLALETFGIENWEHYSEAMKLYIETLKILGVDSEHKDI